MPEYRRRFVEGGTFFFTLALADRRKNTLVRHISHVREAWRDVAHRHPFETVAAVVLPDHMHVVIALPAGDRDYVNRISRFKAGVTTRLPEPEKGAGRKGERGVWQPRYWEHAIRDDADLANHVHYIHFNPVKHGHVDDMDDWPFSTWHRWKRENVRAWKPPPTDFHVGDP